MNIEDIRDQIEIAEGSIVVARWNNDVFGELWALSDYYKWQIELSRFRGESATF